MLAVSPAEYVLMKALWSILLLFAALASAGDAKTARSPRTIDAAVATAMLKTGAKGLAIAVIDHGRVRYVQAYGMRDKAGDPLKTDTVMYGASLTKTVFAYHVLQLVDQASSRSTRRSARISTSPWSPTTPTRSTPTSTGHIVI